MPSYSYPKSSATIYVEQAFPSGAWVLSAIHNGRRIARTYMGYTKKEAVRLFNEELK